MPFQMLGAEDNVAISLTFVAVHALFKSNFVLEASAFILLAIASHLVGNVAEESNLQAFRSRPGALTGVFLGSITWPLVFAFRMHNISGARNREFFWGAVLCSLRVLSIVFVNTTKRKPLQERTEWTIFSVLGFFLLVTWLNGFGLQTMIMLPLQAVFCGIFLRKIFQRFPESATIGEALLVAGGLSIYSASIVQSALSRSLSVYKAQDLLTVILQIAVLGLGFIPWIYKAFLCITRNSEMVSLVASIFVVVAALAPGWVWLVTGVHRHPILWIMDFMLEKPVHTIGLSVYWMGLMCVVPLLYRIAKRNEIPHILLRKAYHLLAVSMFVPALFIQPQFLHLAFTVAFVAFAVIEMIRIWNVPVLGPKINEFMDAFADSRDSQKLIVSHFSLLLGCALPVWLHAEAKVRPLASFAGILSIGIGDTMASFVGYNYGSWKLSKSNKKTVEGTTAGILSMVLACSFIQYFFPGCFGFSRMLMASIFAGLVEAYITQLDNAFVPLVFYGLLCI